MPKHLNKQYMAATIIINASTILPIDELLSFLMLIYFNPFILSLLS